MVTGIGEAAAIVTTLKNASDLVQKLRGSDSKEELQTGVAALTELVLNARVSALDLVEQKALLMDERAVLNKRVQELEAEVHHLTDFDEHSKNYERIQTRSGTYVYREKNPAGGSAGAPYLCPTCFGNRKKSLLQPWDTQRNTFRCYPCSVVFDL